jgi:hypothetical protein
MGQTIIEQVDAETAGRVYKTPAKRVMEKLEPLSSHVESYQKRWFWELLQNACDYNDNVKIELEITPEFLYFRHNGKPFKLSQALNLILPDSDKDQDEDPEVIGQYGSGFISTHILSTHVTITGSVYGDGDGEFSFEFLLDRSKYTDRDFLAETSRKAEQQFKDSLVVSKTPDPPFTTQFKYNLKETLPFVDASKSIELGVSFVEDILPYVFAFQRRLIEVSIKTGNQKSIYRCSDRTENKVITTVINYEADSLVAPNSYTIRVFSEQDTFVAVEEEDRNLKSFKEDVPKLFKIYPLIGAHDFPFPCVIHSLSLSPVSERYGVALSINDKINRGVIQNATIAYGKMLAVLSENEKCNSIFNICTISTGSFSGEIQTWFKNHVYTKLKNQLLTNKIITVEGGTRKELKGSYIPTIDKDYFTDYLKIISKTTLIVPIENESKQWADVINFSIFTDQQLTVKNLLELISKTNSPFETLLKYPGQVFEWIKELLQVILKSGQKDLLTTFSIVPQQDRKLRTLRSDLFWDDEIPDELKDILELISEKSFRQILMHKAIEEVGSSLLESKKQKTTDDILDAIDKALQKENTKDPKYMEALRRILKWTDKFRDDELRTKMSWFSAERAPLVMRTLASEANRDMAFRIIQSGKIEVLSQLADDKVSKEKLEMFVALAKTDVSIGSLLELADIAKDVPMSDILDSAKELKIEAIDREFKTKQGSSIESLVETLLNEDLPQTKYKCKYRGAGAYDFEIVHLKTNRSVYLEIKSHANGSMLPSKLHVSQAKMAVDCKREDNYVLGVIERPNVEGSAASDYIRDNMRFTFGIGNNLAAAVERYINLEPFHTQQDGVSIEFEKTDVKFLIDRSLTNGYPFGGFKAHVKRILER